MDSCIRFLIYDPKSEVYIRMSNGGWVSEQNPGAANSYSSFEEANKAISTFDSLKKCIAVKVRKTVEISE